MRAVLCVHHNVVSCIRDIIVTGITLFLAPSSNRTCPSHYELFGDDCYFVSYVKLSWQEAREACQRESGGDLISVHSPFEQGRKQLDGTRSD